MPQAPSRIRYEERFLVYADILGWSDLVGESVADDSKNLLVAQAIQWLMHEEGWYRMPGIASETKTQVTVMSDSIIASCAIDSDYINDLILHISKLVLLLLRKGIYVRGAVVTGLLFHEQNAVVGPAAVTAVRLERATRFPRIAVHESALSYFSESDGHIYRGKDGVPTLDSVRFLYGTLDDPQDGLVRDGRQVMEVVRSNMKSHSSDEELLARDHWMYGYLESLAGTRSMAAR